MNCSLTWSWNSCSHSIKPKQIFFHSINWRFCSFLVWIHSTWRYFRDFHLNKESSIIDFNDEPDDLPQCINNFIQTSIMMQTQIQATNMRWGGTTLKSLEPCLVPMLNTTIRHGWLIRSSTMSVTTLILSQIVLKCMIWEFLSRFLPWEGNFLSGKRLLQLNII